MQIKFVVDFMLRTAYCYLDDRMHWTRAMTADDFDLMIGEILTEHPGRRYTKAVHNGCLEITFTRGD